MKRIALSPLRVSSYDSCDTCFPPFSLSDEVSANRFLSKIDTQNNFDADCDFILSFRAVLPRFSLTNEVRVLGLSLPSPLHVLLYLERCGCVLGTRIIETNDASSPMRALMFISIQASPWLLTMLATYFHLTKRITLPYKESSADYYIPFSQRGLPPARFVPLLSSRAAAREYFSPCQRSYLIDSLITHAVGMDTEQLRRLGWCLGYAACPLFQGQPRCLSLRALLFMRVLSPTYRTNDELFSLESAGDGSTELTAASCADTDAGSDEQSRRRLFGDVFSVQKEVHTEKVTRPSLLSGQEADMAETLTPFGLSALVTLRLFLWAVALPTAVLGATVSFLPERYAMLLVLSPIYLIAASLGVILALARRTAFYSRLLTPRQCKQPDNTNVFSLTRPSSEQYQSLSRGRLWAALTAECAGSVACLFILGFVMTGAVLGIGVPSVVVFLCMGLGSASLLEGIRHAMLLMTRRAGIHTEASLGSVGFACTSLCTALITAAAPLGWVCAGLGHRGSVLVQVGDEVEWVTNDRLDWAGKPPAGAVVDTMDVGLGTVSLRRRGIDVLVYYAVIAISLFIYEQIKQWLMMHGWRTRIGRLGPVPARRRSSQKGNEGGPCLSRVTVDLVLQALQLPQSQLSGLTSTMTGFIASLCLFAPTFPLLWLLFFVVALVPTVQCVCSLMRHQHLPWRFCRCYLALVFPLTATLGGLFLVVLTNTHLRLSIRTIIPESSLVQPSSILAVWSCLLAMLSIACLVVFLIPVNSMEVSSVSRKLRHLYRANCTVCWAAMNSDASTPLAEIVPVIFDTVITDSSGVPTHTDSDGGIKPIGSGPLSRFAPDSPGVLLGESPKLVCSDEISD